jgi:hypothetical protein
MAKIHNPFFRDPNTPVHDYFLEGEEKKPSVVEEEDDNYSVAREPEKRNALVELLRYKRDKG